MPKVKKVHAVQKAENPEFRDKNIQLHKKYVTAKEELALSLKGKSSDKIKKAERHLEDVKNEFFDANKGLAYSMARSFLNQNNDLGQDYYSAASLGIWEAFLKWDPTVGVTFGTFSRQFIKGRISRTVRQSEYNHISQGDFNKRRDVRDAFMRLQEKLNRTPTYEEVAKEANVTASLAERAMQNRATSLDTPIGDGESTLIDLVSDQLVNRNVDDYSEDKIERMLEELGETELWIMLSRGDVLGIEPQSLVEIADRIGIGREIARRIEQRAKFKIVQSMLSIENDALPDIEEIAKAAGLDISSPVKYEEFHKMLRSGYTEIKGRWERASLALRKPKSLDEDDSLYRRQARIDRIGEEFLASAARLITQMASTYSKPGKREAVGIDEMAVFIWRCLKVWSPEDGGSFEAFARNCIAKNFSKLNNAKPDYSGLEYNEIKYMWGKIKKLNLAIHN